MTLSAHHCASLQAEFLTRGWVKFASDPAVIEWLSHAGPAVQIAVNDPANAQWLRCGGTWFAGVNILPNDRSGAIAGSGPLKGDAVQVLTRMSLPIDQWDAAQISVIYPGYPKQSQETDAAFRFRRNRDAAHVDGLSPIGPEKRRHLSEPHAFVLGLPLNATSATASPLVVWEGSHEIMRAALGATLSQYPADRWRDIDLTESYHAARRKVFDTCSRVPVHAQPGEVYLLHRLALHGVAPWGEIAKDSHRSIAYFRPDLPTNISDWINAP